MSGLESLLTGRVLADRYRIEEVIGRGGMGAVYRATDERLGRQVAVKVITLSGASDPDSRQRLQQRFLREARAAAALPHHPNVVPVYDYGTDPTLQLDFIVMELLRGEDLATHLARAGTPPLTAALHVLTEAARGIAVGHRSGLVHRDVKPGNIFLVHDDGETQVRVLDFGIAKLADDDTLTQLTQDGRTPLSPAFASPEQLRGLSRITLASDVFSLGAIGYQLLTGERPFSESDRNRMSLGMPVDVPSPRARNPAVPPALADLIRRALSYHPEERFADAGEFASVLDQVRRELGSQPVPPYGPRPAVVPPVLRTPPPPDDRTEFLDDQTLLDPAAAAARARAPGDGAGAAGARRHPALRGGRRVRLVARQPAGARRGRGHPAAPARRGAAHRAGRRAAPRDATARARGRDPEPGGVPALPGRPVRLRQPLLRGGRPARAGQRHLSLQLRPVVAPPRRDPRLDARVPARPAPGRRACRGALLPGRGAAGARRHDLGHHRPRGCTPVRHRRP